MKYTLAVAALIATAAAADEKKKDEKKDDKAATCPLTKFELFEDDKCEKLVKETAKVDAQKKLAKGGCVKTGDTSIKNTCDAKALTTQAYKKADCTGDTDGKATVTEWGKCTKVDAGWIKVTGAKALMASATIALAFVGSQF